MDKDEIVVVDKNLRFRDDKMEQELKEAAIAKLTRAEAKENARFEKRTIIDRFLDAIDRITSKTDKKKELDEMIKRNNRPSEKSR